MLGLRMNKGGGGPREQRDRPGAEVMGHHAPCSNINRLQNKGVWTQGRIPKKFILFQWEARVQDQGAGQG